MHFDFAMVLIFVVAGVGFAITNLLIGAVLRPRFPNADSGSNDFFRDQRRSR